MLSSELFLKSAQSSDWYKPGLKILCACSAGVDSTVLLHLLSELPDLEIELIHFNHQLRGSESDADMEFVKHLGQRYNYPVHIHSEDIRTYAEAHGLSIEEAGSQRRRAVFLEQKSLSGFELVATGQHQDDQIETLLLNLYFGTGFKGLNGISAYQGGFVRPLLEFKRHDIVQYSQRNQIEHREDKSNSELNYLRNNIRTQLIPYLEQSGDSTYRDLIIDMGKQGSALYKKLEQSIEDIDNKEITSVKSHKISLGLRELSVYFSPIQKVIFDRAFQSISLMSQGLSSKHFEALKSLLPLEAIGKEIQLPASLLAYRDRDQITILRESEMQWTDIPLSSMSESSFPFFSLEHISTNISDSIKNPHYFWYQDGLDKYLLRRHREGDKLLVDSAGRRITINQILQEAHVAPHIKKWFPVLLHGDEIVWVPGIRTSYSAMLDISTSRENEKKHCVIAQFQEGIFE